MSTPKIEIITLVENLAYQQGTKGEHGLAFVVRTGGKQILFDTGQSGLLIENARKMNVDLSTIDEVVISHGHYDHTGGLDAFFSINNHAPVWLKPQAFDEKLSKSTGNLRFIGIDRKIMNENRERFQLVRNITEVAPRLIVVPNIGNYYDFEQPSQTMMVRTGDKVSADLFEDELFMLYNNPEGLTVFTGCAHRGIGNICRTAMAFTGNKNIRLVLGGTHLKGASGGRINKTVEAFENIKVSGFGLCHCTGLPAFLKFSTKFGEKVRYAHVGTRFFPYD